MIGKVKKIWVLDVFGKLEDVWNGEMISPCTLYRERRWMESLPPKILGEMSSIWLASHRWMRGTSYLLEQLMTPRGLRSVSSNYETRKTTFPHMQINESISLISWKSKPQFFSSDEREKNRSFEGLLWGHGPKFLDWALALSEYIEWTQEEQVVIGGPSLKSNY